MTQLTTIGLGAMGNALARAFLGAGHRITVWNRSAEKCQPFALLGAEIAPDIATAVEASPVTVICIDNYAVTRRLIEDHGLQSRLDGRTLIQLSTGTPSEAYELERLLQDFDCTYLDGAIMPYPDEIGTDSAQILFAGPEDAFLRCRTLLDCLGGDLRYLGSNIRAAATIDMALLTQELCTYIGAIHAANLCESEGMEAAMLAALYPPGHAGLKPIRVIEANRYDAPGATLVVWEAALQRIQAQARDAGINSEIPDLVSSLFRRAIAAGHGSEDLAAIIKILRGENKLE